MQRLKSTSWMVARSVVVLGLLMGWMGCDDGCQPGHDVVDPAEAGADQLDEEVSAVVRLSRFNERNFDLQHWWAESVEAGRLVGRDDQPGGIAPQPAREFHRWVTQVVGEEQAGKILWRDAVEIAVWESDDEGWRWAVGLTVDDRDIDWSALGTEHRHWANPVADETLTVVAGEDYYGTVKEIANPGETGEEYRLVLSNFEAGAAYFGEALALTGEGSGVEAAELYTWPRRLGLSERYGDMADEMGATLVAHGFDIPPSQLGPHLLRIRWADLLSEQEFWPEIMRMWMSLERDEETHGAESIRLNLDISREDATLVDVLARSLRNDDHSDVRWFTNPHGQLHIQGTPELWPAVLDLFNDAVGLDKLRELDDVEDGELFERLERMLASNAGTTSLVALPTRVPPPHTGEFMLRWELIDEGIDRDNVFAFHQALMEEFWLPLFRRDQVMVHQPDDELFHELDGTWGSVVFQIGHGHGPAGACWVDKEGWFTVLYGARPCERLAEQIAASEIREPTSAMSYTGTLTRTLEKVFLPHDHELDEVFDEDLVVHLDVDRIDDDQVGLSMETRETLVAAHLVDQVPQLRHYWDMSGWSPLEAPITQPGASPPRLQAPGLSLVGIPGLVGTMPTSMLLGMPFSYMPMDVAIFQRYYFDGGLSPHHHHH